jgi:hypothetical protein
VRSQQALLVRDLVLEQPGQQRLPVSDCRLVEAEERADLRTVVLDGIRHRRDRVGVGYTSATRSVHPSQRELAHHGALFGGRGSRKTASCSHSSKPQPDR